MISIRTKSIYKAQAFTFHKSLFYVIFFLDLNDFQTAPIGQCFLLTSTSAINSLVLQMFYKPQIM